MAMQKKKRKTNLSKRGKNHVQKKKPKTLAGKRSRTQGPQKRASKIQSARQKLTHRLQRANEILNRFEKEADTLVKKLMKKGQSSRKDLRRHFDEIASRIRADKILARANGAREELEKEVLRLGEEILDTLKEVEGLVKGEKVTSLFSKAQNNFSEMTHLLLESGLVEQAKQTLQNTKRGVLSLLSIPTQQDVEKLERKIVSLERRLSSLSRKAA